MKIQAQKRLSDTRGSAGIDFFKFWYKTFGYKHTKILVWVVTFFYMLLDREANRRVAPYIRHRFPQANFFSRRKHVWFLFAHQGMCLLWQELYDSLGRTYEVVYDSKETEEISSAEKAAVIIYSHFGPWQLMMRCPKRTKNSVNILAQPDLNVKINKMKSFSAGSEAGQVVQVAADPGSLFILQQALERDEFVAIMGDRNFEDTPLAVDFLGSKAYFPVASFYLAARMNCPVICMFAHEDESGKYVLEFCEAMRPMLQGRDRQQLRPYLERYTKHLEKLCMKYPYDCFSMTNFWEEE